MSLLHLNLTQRHTDTHQQVHYYWPDVFNPPVVLPPLFLAVQTNAFYLTIQPLKDTFLLQKYSHTQTCMHAQYSNQVIFLCGLSLKNITGFFSSLFQRDELRNTYPNAQEFTFLKMAHGTIEVMCECKKQQLWHPSLFRLRTVSLIKNLLKNTLSCSCSASVDQNTDNSTKNQ